MTAKKLGDTSSFFKFLVYKNISETGRMNKDNLPNFSYKALTIAVGVAMFGQSQIALANDEPITTLDTIVIEATTSNGDIPAISEKPLTDKTTAKKITEELIMDNRDLVRYNPEVSIGEVGRYGSKGFNIQGMEGNRVAMVIDGVRVPEIETNEFFTPYGYMNESRFMADVETLQSVEINKGADSLNSGSGAIGGAVVFKSREPDDLIKNGQSIGGYVKGGYTSKNEEWLRAFGVAGRSEKWSALVNYARREGHELKNHDMRKFDSTRLKIGYNFPENEKGTGGIYPDPTHYTQDSTLVKAYYQPTEQHKFGFNGSYQYLINQNTPVTKVTYSGQGRQGFDENERTAYNFNYQYMPNNSHWLDNIKLDYTDQSVVTVADTYVFGGYTYREYRPNYFDTKQTSVKLTTIPLMPPENRAWLGEHTIQAGLEYADQYYDPYMITEDKSSIFENPSAMMLPSQTDIFSASIKDSIYLNDKFQFKAGLRYDNYERQVVNIRPVYKKILERPGAITSIAKAYQSGKLTEVDKKDAWTWQTAFSYKPKNDIQLDYQIGTGFLMPLSNQVYSGFAQFGIEQKPNPTLKPEESLNQQLSIQKSWEDGFAKLTAYYNKYDNFIDSERYDRGTVTGDGSICDIVFTACFQYINKDSATSKGIALTGNYRLPYQTYGNFDVRGQLAYQQGKANDGSNLLAIQPLNGLIGLRYQPHNERFEINAVGRYFAKKDANQTKRMVGGRLEEMYLTTPDGNLTTDKLMKDVWVFDLYGNVKLMDGLSLQAGVYNLTDEKYLPWDNIRTLAVIGINNMVKGNGINRYTAPGRNFAVSLNYEF